MIQTVFQLKHTNTEIIMKSILQEKGGGIELESTNTSNNLGYALAISQKYTDALSLFEAGIQADPTDVFAYRSKGAVLNRLERYGEAIKAFDQAIALDNTDALSYRYKGYALNQLDEYDQAIDILSTAIALNSKDALSCNYKGHALGQLNKPTSAIAWFDKALKLDPCLANALENKGMMRIQLKKYTEALKTFDQAILVAPKFVTAYGGKGYALSLLGKHKEAFRWFSKAIELDPEYPHSYTSSHQLIATLQTFISLDKKIGSMDLWQNAIHKFMHQFTGIDLKIVLNIVTKFDGVIDFEKRNSEGDTPLHNALKKEPLDIALITLLLEHGASTNAYNIEEGASPLHLAATANNQLIIELLLKHGADSLALDRYGWLPVSNTSQKPSFQLLDINVQQRIQALMNSGKKHDLDSDDNLAADLALIIRGNIETYKYLTAKGLNIAKLFPNNTTICKDFQDTLDGASLPLNKTLKKIKKEIEVLPTFTSPELDVECTGNLSGNNLNNDEISYEK